MCLPHRQHLHGTYTPVESALSYVSDGCETDGCTFLISLVHICWLSLRLLCPSMAFPSSRSPPVMLAVFALVCRVCLHLLPLHPIPFNCQSALAFCSLSALLSVLAFSFPQLLFTYTDKLIITCPFNSDYPLCLQRTAGFPLKICEYL